VRLTPPFRLVVVGSPGYLARNGQPERPDDLRRHACLRLRRSDGSLALWSLDDGGRTIEIAVSGPLIANDFPTMLGAAVEGMGLAQVPAPIAAEAVRTGKLVRVLEPFVPLAPGVFLYYPSRLQMMPKLRAFVDHVKSRSGSTHSDRSSSQ
jgi:DNA-binding transcriptional LysR family regulator